MPITTNQVIGRAAITLRATLSTAPFVRDARRADHPPAGGLAKVDAVKPFEDEWLGGRAGTRVHLTALEEWVHLPDDGLVLTREWFAGAFLDETRSVLRIIVRANPDAQPLYPAVGDEREESEPIFSHDLVGCGIRARL